MVGIYGVAAKSSNISRAGFWVREEIDDTRSPLFMPLIVGTF